MNRGIPKFLDNLFLVTLQKNVSIRIWWGVRLVVLIVVVGDW